jgi:opacity protein-like surface antigen
MQPDQAGTEDPAQNEPNFIILECFMKSLRHALVITVSSGLAVMAGNSMAQTEARGLYATVYAQTSQLGSTPFNEIGNSGLGSGLSAKFGQGLGLGGDIGIRYGNGWAAELEWNWRRHDLKSVSRNTTNVASDGDFASNIFFVNGLRRFIGPAGGWTPYAGAGLGWVQEIDFDINSGGAERAWSKKGKLAVQLIGGAEIPLSNSWRLAADVRLLRVGSVELPAEEGVTGRLSSPRYNPVSVQVGLRRSF